MNLWPLTLPIIRDASTGGSMRHERVQINSPFPQLQLTDAAAEMDDFIAVHTCALHGAA
jgi:hypothetical protein